MKKWKKQQNNINWKISSMIAIGVLLSVMFLLPSIIVLPFKGDQSETEASTSTPTETETKNKERELASPFHVNVFRTKTEKVEEVPLEEYVVHVVASEMPADFELEALKAQALAARTYVVRFLVQGVSQNIPGGADVTDTIEHQVYKNEDELRELWGSDYHWKIDKITQAVYETQGKIITYDNQPITPAFFSTSNGYTENSENYWPNELPYLRIVESPWDEEISPKFFSQKTFTKSQLEELLGVPVQSEEKFHLTRTDSQRVETMKVGEKSFSGREVRTLLDLPSNDFTITKKNDHYVFTTRGYGHGIGMSQYGANGMALEGKSSSEIVSYYYKGTEVSSLEEAAPTLLAKSE